MSDGGPATYNDWRIASDNSLEFNAAEVLVQNETAYNAGVAEGRRYERENQLLVVATAMTCEDDDIPFENWKKPTKAQKSVRFAVQAEVRFDKAVAMLAESEKRRRDGKG